jgi:uncharacterized protein YggU (UPF0235/DUF167 family)
MASARARVRLRVVPGARQTGIVGRHGEGWKVRIQASPERGAANDALVSLLAGALGVRTTAVRLVAGHGARDKIVELTGLDPEDVERRLTAAQRDQQ